MTGPCLRHEWRRGFIAALIVIIAIAACPGSANSEGLKREFENAKIVRLKSRDIRIADERISPSFLETVRSAPKRKRHAFVALAKPPDLGEKKKLEAFGLLLLFPVHPDFWVATVRVDFFRSQGWEDGMVRWIGPILPADKIDAALSKGRLPDWAADKEGKLKVVVETFQDVTDEDFKTIIGRFTDEIDGSGISNSFHPLRIKFEQLADLASQDIIKAIEPGPLPFQPLLNFARRVTRADEAQRFDPTSIPPTYDGLSGSGVQIGIFDSGIDRDHDDFDIFDATGAVIDSRILAGPDDTVGHGTNVAGIAAGSGRQSSECRDTIPYLWRGLAPESDLISVRPDPRFLPLGTVGARIRDYGMDLSNHSYVQVLNGQYTGGAASIDELIRGDYLAGGIPVPPRAMIWAAGNDGRIATWGINEGYFSVGAPAKNSIAVGATIANTAGAIDRLYADSSLGPTFDGRIKPDIMAPGSGITTTRNGTNCYTTQDGTSLSAPAVAGIAALVLEQYSATFSADLDSAPPLPSTLKAVLIQTADDLIHTVPDRHDSWDNPDTGGHVFYHEGPDYATGFGRANAAEATRLVRERRLLEGTISDPAQRDEYCVVAAGAGRLQATLAWDDEPDEDRFGPVSDPALVNDLELRLSEPSGAIHRPWVLDPIMPATETGARDPVDPADIRPATEGEDHINTVEQITIAAASAGGWRMTVSIAAGSVGLLESPQPYSIAADGPIMESCPDLVITDFRSTGPAELRMVDGSSVASPHLPVRAVVRHQGAGEAFPFKLAASYRGGPTSPDRDFVVAFTAPGGSDVWYPRRIEPLAPGMSWSVEGELIFHPSASGNTVSVIAEADSCSGDEFFPGFCRAPETSETNNFSSRFSVSLP